MNINLYCDYIETREQLRAIKNDISKTETQIAKLNIEIRGTQYTDSLKKKQQSDTFSSIIILRDNLKNKLNLLLEDEKETKELLEKRTNEIKELLDTTIKTEHLEILIFYNNYILKKGKTLEDIKEMLDNQYQMATIWRISSKLNKAISNELKIRNQRKKQNDSSMIVR